jgi:chromosome segregation ATPase
LPKSPGIVQLPAGYYKDDLNHALDQNQQLSLHQGAMRMNR